MKPIAFLLIVLAVVGCKSAPVEPTDTVNIQIHYSPATSTTPGPSDSLWYTYEFNAAGVACSAFGNKVIPVGQTMTLQIPQNDSVRITYLEYLNLVNQHGPVVPEKTFLVTVSKRTGSQSESWEITQRILPN